jgi:hypothetical protein
MSQGTKREYLEIVRLRYRAAKRGLKTVILDEFCANTGFNRKYAIRLIGSGLKEKKNSGRKPVYSKSAFFHLKRMWLLSHQPCSKRMVGLMRNWLPFYLAPAEVKTELFLMSAATIDRLLRPHRALELRKKRTGTKPGRLLKTVIPIKPFNYNITRPGFVEADTVAHCGGSLLGDFIWSLTFTDTLTGWTENRGVWGKGALNTLEAIKDIEKEIPFSIEAFNSDNGSEFLNHHLIRYFTRDGATPEQRKFLMTRSRSYRKNDNCHVEQKNWTSVREIFGYERFDFKELLVAMNDIYKNEHRLLINFFFPQMKLKTKLRVGAKYKRTYDKPQTPYERLVASGTLSKKKHEELQTLMAGLNPFELMKRRESKLKAFFELKRKLQSSRELDPAL